MNGDWRMATDRITNAPGHNLFSWQLGSNLFRVHRPLPVPRFKPSKGWISTESNVAPQAFGRGLFILLFWLELLVRAPCSCYLLSCGGWGTSSPLCLWRATQVLALGRLAQRCGECSWVMSFTCVCAAHSEEWKHVYVWLGYYIKQDFCVLHTRLVSHWVVIRWWIKGEEETAEWAPRN